MKKYTILLILCLYFSYVKAQTILVNSNVISVHEDVAFPFWLDSMSTIEIGTQVVSISALEFNIVPATNGNSLVFSQTKTITSQETVPNGMTWKITAVLLDSTAINNSSSSGGGQVIVSGSGGNMPIAVSEESPASMNFGSAMVYCKDLVEDGFDDWVIPTFEGLVFVSSGGASLPGNISSNQLWTAHTGGLAMNSYTCLSLSNGNIELNEGQTIYTHIRCVRHGSISVSGSGSSSSGSNTASTLGSGMPTMISNESANTMHFGDAILYCDSLNELGFSDWIMPTIDQLTYAISGGSVIPDARTQNYIWTRTGPSANPVVVISLLKQANINDSQRKTLSTQSLPNAEYLINTRCVR